MVHKWPWISKGLLEQARLPGVSVVFILRNPYHAFSSLIDRFHGHLNHQHSFMMYERTASVFLSDNYPDVVRIKYEKLFVGGFEELIERLELDPNTDEKLMPKYFGPNKHLQRRYSQVGEPFEIRSPNIVAMPRRLYERIRQSPIVRKMGYREPHKTNLTS